MNNFDDEITLCGVVYVKKSTIKDNSEELLKLRKTFDKLSADIEEGNNVLSNVPKASSKRVEKEQVKMNRTITNHRKNNFYPALSYQKPYDVDHVDTSGRIYFKSGRVAQHFNIYDVIDMQRIIDEEITMEEAKKLAKEMGFTDYIFNRLYFAVKEGNFDSQIERWSQLCIINNDTTL